MMNTVQNNALSLLSQLVLYTQVTCTRRDYLLYALSVGVPESDLRWLYELGKKI